jgi:hypothetical protein
MRKRNLITWDKWDKNICVIWLDHSAKGIGSLGIIVANVMRGVQVVTFECETLNSIRINFGKIGYNDRKAAISTILQRLRGYNLILGDVTDPEFGTWRNTP